MSQKISSVGKSVATVGSAAEAAWIRESVGPTAAANAGSARPVRSSAFHSGKRSGGRNYMASEPLSSSWPSSWHRGLPEHALQARPESFATSCPARLFYGFWRCGGPVRSMVAKDISTIAALYLRDFLRRHRPSPDHPIAPDPVTRLAFGGPTADRRRKQDRLAVKGQLPADRANRSDTSAPQPQKHR